MKKKLLISGAGGSLFPYLFKKLEARYELYLLDSDPMVPQWYPDQKIFTVPLVSDECYESEVIKIIEKYDIDFYIPLIDEEILKAINISKQIDVKVLAPSKEFVALALNKFHLMHTLSEHKISTIETIMADEFSDQIPYPVFLKPNIGRGSRGIKKINNHKEFEAYFELEDYTKDEVLVQPFIGGDEYTVSVTVNNLNKLIAIVPKRVYIKKGITKHAQSIKDDKIEKVCRKIVEVLKPKGSFNVQLKVYHDAIYIFEINPRYSTTLVLSIESGINEIDFNISYYDEENVPEVSRFEEKTLIRRWENIFY